MQINQIQFSQIVETAKLAAAGSPAWLRAIEKAAAAIVAGEMIITTLSHGALVTSKNGSYMANGRCACLAAQRGHKECYHRAGARLWALYEEAMLKARPATLRTMRDARVQRIVRSVERDPRSGARVNATYCDGWAI